MMQLIDLKSIGPIGGQELVNEVFYRSFDNRRQVGSYCGLAGTPYDSGESRREQGQGRQPARPQACDRARLAMAAASARQRAQLLVPPACRRHQGAGAPHRHRGAGAQADGGALALSHDRRGAERRRAAPKPLNGPRAMMADVNQDRRVTVTHPGSTHTVLLDGSRLCWALPSPVHEGLGYRAFVPDRIQGDAVFPAYVIHGPVQDHVSPSIARPIVPSIKRRAGLAAVKAWPGYDAACRARAVPASLDRGCARRSTGSRSGRRNALGRTKKLKRPLPEEFAAMPAS